MTRSDLIRRFNEEFGKCAGLMDKKNNDYSSDEDALANLRLFGFMGVAVRLSDKLMRLIHFAKGHALQVQDEKIQDTLRDIVNYGIIALVMLEEEKHGE